MSAAELTINVTEFKAKCLGILERVGRGDLKRVNITKRGTVVASVQPPEQATERAPYRFDLEEFRASLGADRLEYSADFDASEPFLDAEALAEFEQNAGALHGGHPPQRDQAA